MIFTCKNCNGNVVYDPKLGSMYCPYCGGTETQEVRPDTGVVLCRNCNAELKAGPYTSAMICPACGTGVVFDERTVGEMRPNKIIPFKVDRPTAIDLIKKHIQKRIFTPDTFILDENLRKLKGTYVPFWMYDFDSHLEYKATGTKVRSWTSGNYRYTETSTYSIERNMDFTFFDVPADASIAQDDERMDLMEPFDYGGLVDFQEKYMAGFNGEIPSVTADISRPRVEAKASSSAIAYVRESLSGYTSVTNERSTFKIDPIATDMDMIPVWEYEVPYKDKNYRFHINGQTGKIVGETPIALSRVLGFSGFMFGSLVLIAWAVIGFLTGV